jgi:phosphoribosyl 1,2-cyclic phosphodiesterase
VNITFYGVRGSTPCPSDDNQRYGGNTSCVALDAPGCDPIVLDLGTGLRFWGDHLPHDGSFRGHALVTHLHWDHVQGLPFFVPVLSEGARLDIYGPPQDNMLDLADAFAEFMRPPYFPVRVTDLPGEFGFHTLDVGRHLIGGAEVTVASVPHIGPTNGYRIEAGGVSVVYVSDHQQPTDGTLTLDPGVVELCRDADLLIHDAQYRSEEFALKNTWGHCTSEFALHLANRAGVRRLALFHHDPGHNDAQLDAMLAEARAHPFAAGIDEVIAAHEGLTLVLEAVAPPGGVAVGTTLSA